MKQEYLETGTVRSFFVKIDSVNRIFSSDKDLVLQLWRASRTDQPKQNPLEPDFEPRDIGRGLFRDPDVTIKKINDIEYVIPKIYQKFDADMWKVQGTSLFDRANTFRGKNWEYIEIPAGTDIPEGILIIKDDFNEQFKATHYSIVPDRMMTLEKFRRLLKQLLMNVLAKKGIKHG